MVSFNDNLKMATILEEVKSKLQPDTPELRARRYFRDFNEYIGDEPNAPHHIELCDSLQSGQNIIGTLPRSSGKTTISTVRYPAWKLGEDRGLRIIIGSITATLAEAASRNIDSLMKRDRYRTLYGNLIPTTRDSIWNTVEKIVYGRPPVNSLGFRVEDKDASIFVVGVGGSVVGRRADIIIIDDIIDRRSARSDVARSDVRHWISEELLGATHRKTQIILLGTRFSGKDIYIENIAQTVRAGDYILKGNMGHRLLDEVRRYEQEAS